MSLDSLDKRIAYQRSRRMAHESIRGIDSTPRIVRDSRSTSQFIRGAQSSEQLAQWHKRGHYLYFCIHDKSKFVPCTPCRRDAKQAELNLEMFQEQLAKLKNKLGL